MFKLYPLSALIGLSLGSGILLLLGTKQRVQWARWFALVSSLLCITVGIFILSQFDGTNADLQFKENKFWIPHFHLYYSLGIDGLALSLILLTLLINFLIILISWHRTYAYPAQYLGSLFITQAIVIAAFCATDALFFYLCWEAMLIPVMLSIGIWGSTQSGQAAMKFFVYTLVGSSPLLMAFLYLGHLGSTPNFNVQYLHTLAITFKEQLFVFAAFYFAFAVKMPLWPFHTWLPETHTEASTENSIVLSAIMLKLGAYGFLRFCVPIVPDACRFLATILCILGLIAGLYAGLIALLQKDMKKLIAYSSISHMGLILLGIFLIFPLSNKNFLALFSLQAVVMQMIAHALSATGLFSGIGILYTRFKSRLLQDYAGVASIMPALGNFFILFTCSSIGVPGTAGFVSDVCIMLAALEVNFWLGVVTAITFFLGAGYMLFFYVRLFWGKLVLPVPNIATENLFIGEKVSFTILSIGILGLGISPSLLFTLVQPSLETILALSVKSKL